jgi:hypothetical protein
MLACLQLQVTVQGATLGLTDAPVTRFIFHFLFGFIAIAYAIQGTKIAVCCADVQKLVILWGYDTVLSGYRVSLGSVTCARCVVTSYKCQTQADIV